MDIRPDTGYLDENSIHRFYLYIPQSPTPPIEEFADKAVYSLDAEIRPGNSIREVSPHITHL